MGGSSAPRTTRAPGRLTLVDRFLREKTHASRLRRYNCRHGLGCECGGGIFFFFFLDARDAATPRAVCGSAALTGDRLRAETEAAPVQRGRAREAARGTSARFAPQGAECLLPPLSSAWLCAAGVG